MYVTQCIQKDKNNSLVTIIQRVYFMQWKLEVLEKVKEYETAAISESGRKIGTLLTDNEESMYLQIISNQKE